MANAIARILGIELAAFVIIFCVSDIKFHCFNSYFLRVTSQLRSAEYTQCIIRAQPCNVRETQKQQLISGVGILFLFNPRSR